MFSIKTAQISHISYTPHSGASDGYTALVTLSGTVTIQLTGTAAGPRRVAIPIHPTQESLTAQDVLDVVARLEELGLTNDPVILAEFERQHPLMVYQFNPGGHGANSYCVLAISKAHAIELVNQCIENDPEGDHEEWKEDPDSYTCTARRFNEVFISADNQ